MPESPDHTLARQQSQSNRSTRDHWNHFAPHRAHLTELLIPGFLTHAGSLCVLGAGNCNDLCLRRLTEAFSEVHLVDLDDAALTQAIQRQGVADSSCLRLHPGLDLMGIAATLSTWAQSPPHPADVDAAIARARTAAVATLPGPFDVVLSSCLLSQLCGYADDMLGRGHLRSPDLRRAIRDRHLRLMVDLLAPGGTGLLICDLVSSAAIRDLPALGRDELPGLVNKLTQRGDHFVGLSPMSIMGVLTGDPTIAPLIADARLIRPWLWKLGPLKTFLVYGVRFRRSREAMLLHPACVRPQSTVAGVDA